MNKANNKNKANKKEEKDTTKESDTETSEKEVKYSFEVVESKRFSKKELRFFNKEMKRKLRSDVKQLVTDAYHVKYRIYLGDKNDDEPQYEEWDVVSFRIREGWYILKDGRFLINPSADDIVIKPDLVSDIKK